MALSMLYGIDRGSMEDQMTEKEKLLGSTVEVLALKVDADQKIIDSWKAKDAINHHDIGLLNNTVRALEKALEHKENLLEELEKEASDSIRNLPYICRCIDQYTTALQMRNRVIEGLTYGLREAESNRISLHKILERQPLDSSQENLKEIKTVLIKMLNSEIKDLNEEVQDLEERIKDLEEELNKEKKLRKDAETRFQQLMGHLIGRASSQMSNRAKNEENEKLQDALSESLAMFSVVSAQLEEEKMKNAVLMENLKEKDAKLHETSKGVGRILRGAVEVGIGMKGEDVKSEEVNAPIVEENNNVELYEVEPDVWNWTKADEDSENQSDQSVTTVEVEKPKKDKKAKNPWNTVLKNGKTFPIPGSVLFRNEAPNKDKKSGKKNGKKSKKAVKVMENGSELVKSVDVGEEEIEGFYGEDPVPNVYDEESDMEDDTVAVTSTWLSKIFWFIVMIFLGLIFKVFL